MTNETSVCPHLEHCSQRFAQADWSSDPPPCLASPPNLMGDQINYADIKLAVNSDGTVCSLNTAWMNRLWDSGTSQLISTQLLRCMPDQRLDVVRVIAQIDKPEMVDGVIELLEEVETNHDNAISFIEAAQSVGPIAGTERILGKLYEFASSTDAKLSKSALTAMVDLDAAAWCDFTRQAWIRLGLSNDATIRQSAFELLKFFSPVAGAGIVSSLLEQSSLMGTIPFRNYAIAARELVDGFGYELMCRQLMRIMRDETHVQTLIAVISIAGALGHRAGNTELLKQLSTIVNTRETIQRGAAMNALLEMDQRERLVDNFELNKDREAILYCIVIANANDWGLAIEPAALTSTMQALDAEVLSIKLAKVIVDRKADEAIPVLSTALQSQSAVLRKFGIWATGRLGNMVAKPELMANLERVMAVPETTGSALWALLHLQLEELPSSTAKILARVYFQGTDHLRMHVRLILASNCGAAVRHELSLAVHSLMTAQFKAGASPVLLVAYTLYQPLLASVDGKQFLEVWRCVADALLQKRPVGQLISITLRAVVGLMQLSSPEVLQAHSQEIRALMDALRRVNQPQLVEPMLKVATAKGLNM